ncbi:amidohydrolase family protein [Olivibacter sp. SDN3]|uniref:amidohydrolase family protein n=1 Tax=Olivibacter sp. SDN3 TaxID=2764720 RepID=UPI002107D34D|nr:amidohydrolase family protein [Olivibacter sp. SDN3]
MALAGLSTGVSQLGTNPVNQSSLEKVNNIGSKFRIKNVRLETGFEYEEGEVSATTTALFTVEISDGKIQAIRPNTSQADDMDAKGLLMLPAFRDMHIHLDKTFYGGPWKATKKRQGGVKGMIALEQEILPTLLETSTQRAEKLIELLQSCGSNFARSHVNIEPTSKLESLQHLQTALANKKRGFEAELVAFPQHGVYYTQSEQWMKEAAEMDIGYIGGVDPYTVDGAIERTMDFTIQLALDHNKGIDIHLHESGDSGLKTVEYLINKVNENPILKGKTYLSHCFVLAALEKAKQEEMAEKLADAKIGVISTIPFGGLIMPIPTLYQYGVEVMTGNDSIIDHWNTWGLGSVLQKANMMAQLYGYSTEFDLSRSLKLATCNVLPLDDNGKQQWPKPGDMADLVLVDASCSAEAVSRVSPVKSLIHRGNVIY